MKHWPAHTVIALVASSTVAFSTSTVRPIATDELEATLDFEAPHTGNCPNGWQCQPPETVFMDDKVFHGGAWSVRLVTDVSNSTTNLCQTVPIDFAGKTVEIRGFLRTHDVADFAGLWLREDGPSGSVEFDNMYSQHLKGTSEWTRYKVSLPLNPKAKRLVFGVLAVGAGTVWADDLELLVDGKPLSKAPKVERIKSAFEADHEFDDGSHLTQTELTKTQSESLFVLGKVWGFLKYHHPRIANGQVHWDFELFRVAPAVLAAADAKARDVALVAWIDGLGKIPECDTCAQPAENAQLKPDFAWINDASSLSKELRDALERVHRNRFAKGDQEYVSVPAGAGNPDFSTENSYAKLSPPDTGYRLLALFRFWNIIEYWFPYRDVIGENWDNVLREFIPRLAAAEQADAYALQMMALIARVHDTHANLWSSLAMRPPRGSCALPVGVRFVEDQAVVVGYTNAAAGAKSGIRIGDVLIAMDGVPVAKSIETSAPFYAASNVPTRLRDQAISLTVGACGAMTLVVGRDGKQLELAVQRVPGSELDISRQRIHDRGGATLQRLSPEVAYLSLADIKVKDIPKYIEDIQGTRGLIIDIRNYPGEFVVFELGQHLVREPTKFAAFTEADLSNPGAFVRGEPVSLQPGGQPYEGKLVILVDETSQSQAEYTTMAFRSAPGAMVIGSTTAGADGNVSAIPLPGGLRSMISGIGVFYPDKRVTQRVGIVPDLEVRPTIAGIRDGRDEVLEEALRQILGKQVDETVIRKLAQPAPPVSAPK